MPYLPSSNCNKALLQFFPNHNLQHWSLIFIYHRVHSCRGAIDMCQNGVSLKEYNMHESHPDELITPHSSKSACEIYSN